MAGEDSVVGGIGLAASLPSTMVDQPTPSDRERPTAEVRLVALERRDPTRDRLPDLTRDVVSLIPDAAAQVPQEPRLHILEQEGDSPLLARSCPVEDRAEVALLRHGGVIDSRRGRLYRDPVPPLVGDKPRIAQLGDLQRHEVVDGHCGQGIADDDDHDVSQLGPCSNSQDAATC